MTVESRLVTVEVTELVTVEVTELVADAVLEAVSGAAARGRGCASASLVLVQACDGVLVGNAVSVHGANCVELEVPALVGERSGVLVDETESGVCEKHVAARGDAALRSMG